MPSERKCISIYKVKRLNKFSNQALGVERIVVVETGGCPHTAIRDDTTMNNQAIAQMEERHDGLEVILVESGGDRPTLFCDLKSHKGLDDVVGWIKRECLFEAT